MRLHLNKHDDTRETREVLALLGALAIAPDADVTVTVEVAPPVRVPEAYELGIPVTVSVEDADGEERVTVLVGEGGAWVVSEYGHVEMTAERLALELRVPTLAAVSDEAQRVEAVARRKVAAGCAVPAKGAA